MEAREKIVRFLKEGLERFNLDTAIIANISNDIYIVAYCENVGEHGLAAGTQFNLQDTYCADVIRTAATRYYRDVAEITEMLKHPCYLNTQLRAYIGTPVFVDGEIWGTLNYSSLHPRKLNYSKDDIQFLENQSREIAPLLPSKK